MRAVKMRGTRCELQSSPGNDSANLRSSSLEQRTSLIFCTVPSLDPPSGYAAAGWAHIRVKLGFDDERVKEYSTTWFDPASFTPNGRMRAVSRVAPACTTAAAAVASSVATSATRGTPSAAMASATEPTDVAMIPGIKRLAETKRVWLLDQFGVLHDGVTAYPGAVDAARRLHESGAKLYVISNSSRRSTNTLRKLEPMGFDPAWFSGVVTSGEVTHQMLASRGDKKELAGTSGAASDGEEDDSDDEFWASLGKKCLHFTWSTRGPIPLDGLNLETVTDPDEADFLLAHC